MLKEYYHIKRIITAKRATASCGDDYLHFQLSYIKNEHLPQIEYITNYQQLLIHEATAE